MIRAAFFQENNDGSFFPCEFCGDPYPAEFLMRHQVR
jgi:hypothetical protein